MGAVVEGTCWRVHYLYIEVYSVMVTPGCIFVVIVVYHYGHSWVQWLKAHAGECGVVHTHEWVGLIMEALMARRSLGMFQVSGSSGHELVMSTSGWDSSWRRSWPVAAWACFKSVAVVVMN